MGGGIAGLSAAWRLQKKGFHGFRSSRNERPGRRQFPLGRKRNHRLPLGGALCPCSRSKGCLRSRAASRSWAFSKTANGKNVIFASRRRNDCSFIGRWQDGIEPAIGLTARRIVTSSKAGGADSVVPRNRQVYGSDGSGSFRRHCGTRQDFVRRVAPGSGYGFTSLIGT